MYMTMKYKWTIKQFLHYFVTAEGPTNQDKAKTQKAKFRNAITQQKEVLYCLEGILDFSSMGIISLQ